MLFEFATGITLCIILGILIGILITYILFKKRIKPKSKVGVTIMLSIIFFQVCAALFSKITIVNIEGNQSYYCLGNLTYKFESGTTVSLQFSPMNYYLINDSDNEFALQEVRYQPKKLLTPIAIRVPKLTCIQIPKKIDYFLNETPPESLPNYGRSASSNWGTRYWLRSITEFQEEFYRPTLNEPILVNTK